MHAAVKVAVVDAMAEVHSLQQHDITTAVSWLIISRPVAWRDIVMPMKSTLPFDSYDFPNI